MADPSLCYLSAGKRVAAGLKAAVHNPRVSDEAKARAQERLEQMDQPSGSHTNGSLSNHVAGGYKATLHSE